MGEAGCHVTAIAKKRMLSETCCLCHIDLNVAERLDYCFEEVDAGLTLQPRSPPDLSDLSHYRQILGMTAFSHLINCGGTTPEPENSPAQK